MIQTDCTVKSSIKSAKRSNISPSEERANNSEKQDITNKWKRCWKNNVRKLLASSPHFIGKLVDFSFQHVPFVSYSPGGHSSEDQIEDFFKNKNKLRKSQLNLKGKYKLMLSFSLGLKHSFSFHSPSEFETVLLLHLCIPTLKVNRVITLCNTTTHAFCFSNSH